MVVQTYIRYYEDPVIVRNTTPVSGRIQWARHLAERIEEPMEIFKQHPSVFDGADGRRVVQMYNRVAQVLLEYEMVWHSAWLKTIEVVDGGSSADNTQEASCKQVMWGGAPAPSLSLLLLPFPLSPCP